MSPYRAILSPPIVRSKVVPVNLQSPTALRPAYGQLRPTTTIATLLRTPSHLCLLLYNPSLPVLLHQPLNPNDPPQPYLYLLSVVGRGYYVKIKNQTATTAIATYYSQFYWDYRGEEPTINPTETTNQRKALRPLTYLHPSLASNEGPYRDLVSSDIDFIKYPLSRANAVSRGIDYPTIGRIVAGGRTWPFVVMMRLLMSEAILQSIINNKG